jgi:hypothetical protein
VALRKGSITTTRAPFSRAFSMNAQLWGLPTTGFAPQTRISRLASMSSGRMPVSVPRVAFKPAAAVLPQMLRSRRVAPSRAKKRRSSEYAWTIPSVP